MSQSLCFIITIKVKQGSLIYGKAKNLGARSNQQLDDLLKRKTVILSDGTKITPEMVFSPAIKGQRLLIADITTMENLKLLPNLSGFDAIFHFTDPSIISLDEYKMKFQSNTNICFFNTQFYIYQSESFYQQLATKTGCDP